jgi:uncharacterized lipoprotein YbaY
MVRKVGGKMYPKLKGRDLESETVIVIQVLDCTLGDSSTKILGETKLTNQKRFPVTYEVQYDDQPLESAPAGKYVIQVRIETNERLDYLSAPGSVLIDPNSSNPTAILSSVGIDLLPASTEHFEAYV